MAVPLELSREFIISFFESQPGTILAVPALALAIYLGYLLLRSLFRVLSPVGVLLSWGISLCALGLLLWAGLYPEEATQRFVSLQPRDAILIFSLAAFPMLLALFRTIRSAGPLLFWVFLWAIVCTNIFAKSKQLPEWQASNVRWVVDEILGTTHAHRDNRSI